jgi:hypothetical protein
VQPIGFEAAKSWISLLLKTLLNPFILVQLEPIKNPASYVRRKRNTVGAAWDSEAGPSVCLIDETRRAPLASGFLYFPLGEFKSWYIFRRVAVCGSDGI